MERNRAIFVPKSKISNLYLCNLHNFKIGKKKPKIFEKSLAKTGFLCYDTYRQLYGGIAQLGAQADR